MILLFLVGFGRWLVLGFGWFEFVGWLMAGFVLLAGFGFLAGVGLLVGL